jgi:alpha-1,6-mannosyltransferase
LAATSQRRIGVKTLHLTNAWHASSGGIGTFYRALMEAANAQGHEIRLVVPGDSTRMETIGAHAKIYYIRAPRAPFNPSYRILYPHRFLTPGTAVQRILDEERPDLIDVSEKYSLPYLAGLLRIQALRIQALRGVNFRPTVIATSCERMDENMAAYLSASQFARAFARLYMKWVYFPMFDHHIAVSEHSAEELREAARGHKVERGVWVRPMGADTARFTPKRKSAAARQRILTLIGGTEHSVLLLYAGRLVPEKNLYLLIDAMEQLCRDPKRDFRLLFAGDGILFEPLKKICGEKIPGCSTFLGHIADRDVLADLFANSDAFVHPNPREPFGIAPLEAMAAGLPLVAPNCGGVTAYANHSNAWLAGQSAESYASAILDICDNPETRARKIEAALVTASQHSWPEIAAGFLKLYGELHGRVQGKLPLDAAPPRFVSTPGDYFGREIVSH